MTSSEDFCLKWNDHQAVFFSAAERLCRTDQLTDVTLVIGSKEFAAHKLVLSACSGYFASLFKPRGGRGTTPLGNVPVHTVMHLKDIEAGHMESILDYMYRGELFVQEGDLMGFLATAKSLQIKGLTDSSTEDIPRVKKTKVAKKRPLEATEDEPQPPVEMEEAEEEEDPTAVLEPEMKKVKEENVLAINTGLDENSELTEPLPPRATDSADDPDFLGDDGDDLDEQEGIIEEYGGEEMEEGGDVSTNMGGSFGDDQFDVDELDETLISLSGSECPECMKSFSSKNCMKRHYSNVHVKDKPFTCWNCDYKASRRTSLRDHCLRQHKMSKEEFAQKARETYKRITICKDDMD